MFALLFLCFGLSTAQPNNCGPGTFNGYTYTASSQYPDPHTTLSPTNNALPESNGAWCPANGDSDPWIMIDLTAITSISQIITQGRADAVQWTTSYEVFWSLDGTNWNYDPVNFGANSDQNASQFNPVFLRARYIKIRPLGYYGYPCMRVCVQTLPDMYLAASSTKDNNGANTYYSGNAFIASPTGWCSSNPSNVPNDFLQIDLGGLYLIDSILIQGYPNQGYVVNYTWQFSFTGELGDWNYGPGTNDEIGSIVTGNNDYTSVSILTGFYEAYSIEARFLRIYPQSYVSWPCLRVGVQVDYSGAQPPLSLSQASWGAKHPGYCSGAYSASSEYQETDCLAFNAQINAQSWCPKTNAVSSAHYLEIDLQTRQTVLAVFTQGRGNGYQYVNSYYLWYKRDVGDTWLQAYSLFAGNYDQTTIIGHPLIGGLSARFWKIQPLGFTNYPSLRICFDFAYYTAPPLPSPATPALPCPGSYSVSSTYPDTNISAAYGTINADGAWCPSTSTNPSDFLQIDLGGPLNIGSISTQGRATSYQWVTSYQLWLSVNGAAWTQFNDLWQANNDQNTIQTFEVAQNGYQFIRIYPVSFYNYPCIRACVNLVP